MDQINPVSWASAVQDATGLSGPAVLVLALIAIAAVVGVAHWYNKRRRR